jgi:hypothetical protein
MQGLVLASEEKCEYTVIVISHNIRHTFGSSALALALPALERPKATLLLNDIENLAGSSKQCTKLMLKQISRQVSGVVDLSECESVSACGKRAMREFRGAEEVKRLLGGIDHHLIRGGVDGADQALLAYAQSCDLATYKTLLICSGDHGFASLAKECRGLGLFVYVIARKHCLASKLREQASQVQYFRPLQTVRGRGD